MSTTKLAFKLKNVSLDIEVVDGHAFTFTPTGENGVDSGRPRWRVVCTTCNETVHEGTTSRSAQVRFHLAAVGGGDR